ncbi:MAG: putative toxin-antitoxin system toxin component, PIN family [Planctomycetaceae bacterium]
MKIVFDANVLIPMILEASASTRLFTRLRAAGHEVYSSPQILDEVADKLHHKPELRKWLATEDEEIDRFIDRLPKLLNMVRGVLSAQGAVPEDPKDDKIIATALEASADYIVSEDKHLLNLGRHQTIPILNRAHFSTELDRLGVPRIIIVTIIGGPVDGRYEITESCWPGDGTSAVDHAIMMYLLFKDMPLGSRNRGMSPERLAKLHGGDLGQWGVHDYRLTRRDAHSMYIEYQKPVAESEYRKRRDKDSQDAE